MLKLAIALLLLLAPARAQIFVPVFVPLPEPWVESQRGPSFYDNGFYYHRDRYRANRYEVRYDVRTRSAEAPEAPRSEREGYSEAGFDRNGLNRYGNYDPRYDTRR
jgi:hypothetical protein